MVSARIGSAPLMMNFRRLRSHALRISGVDRLGAAPARGSAPATLFAFHKSVDPHGRAHSAAVPALFDTSRDQRMAARHAACCQPAF